MLFSFLDIRFLDFLDANPFPRIIYIYIEREREREREIRLEQISSCINETLIELEAAYTLSVYLTLCLTPDLRDCTENFTIVA